MPSFTDRLSHAWNAFMSREPTKYGYPQVGFGYSYRPDRVRYSRGNERSIVNGICNRIAIDAASIKIEHVRLDDRNRYKETIYDSLNECLTTEANIDQTGRQFIQDAVQSMFDEGHVALVPTDTDDDPEDTEAYKVLELRTGKVVEWYPAHVKVLVYNEHTGNKQEVILEKKCVGIVENPLYSIMNEPNSTLQRLIRTLNHLDSMNAQTTSGKLDLIIQLPYVIKSESKRAEANRRRQEIVDQLTGSQYGIAYTDGTEKITQLNRSVDNQLWQQAQDLKAELFNQLGLTQSIFDGTADESTMLNYYSRTIEPILSAISDEMQRKFLSKTARTQGQAIRFFRNPFKLVPAEKLADIADKLTRNEIASSNEMRAEIGWKPVDDPKADELRNKNLNQEKNPDAVSTRENESDEDVVEDNLIRRKPQNGRI